jgi:hypothetical protein
MPTVDSLTIALENALQPDVADRAQFAATAMRRDGAQAGAQRLMVQPQSSF